MVPRAYLEQPVSCRLRQDEDAEEFVEALDADRDQFAELGDPLSNARYKDILVLALPPAYNFILDKT